MSNGDQQDGSFTQNGLHREQTANQDTAGSTVQKGRNPATTYLMVLRYSGQQGAGVNSLSSLQCWAGHTGLPIKIVESIISNTRMESFLNRPNGGSLSLGDYFDMKYYSEVQSKYAIFITVLLKKVPPLKPSMQGLRWSSNKTVQCYDGSSLANSDFCFVEIATLEIGSLASELPKLLDGWRNKKSMAGSGQSSGSMQQQIP